MFSEILVKMESAIDALVALIRQGYTLSSALSGGKDSTCTAILMLEAVRRAGAEVSREHFVTSADTTIENPSMHWHLQAMLDEIRDAYADAGASVSVHVAKPSLASQFVVATIGRGTLPRTPENGVKNGKRIRACAADWKVDPQNRLRVALERSAAAGSSGEVVTILGNRFDESGSRASAMTARSENASRPVRSAHGFLTFSPIAEWSTVCVWAMLSLFADDADRPYPSPISTASIRRLSDLYRAGNEGTCGVILGEGGARAACGSRFGCAFCCVSGERDRSMESMVKEPEHRHLEGLNRFRNYLVAVQWDLGRRELVGRKLSDAGYLAVKPDVLSYRERVKLLQYLLTLDVLEVERAERHEGALATGEIPDTPENRALCDVQFEMVTPAQLVAIDFYLSMHHYAPHAFPALSVWFDVHRLGRRYHVPVLEPLPKADIPHHGWFFVGAYDAEVPTDGLRDYAAEQWNRYLHPERASRYARTRAGEQVVYFEESDQFDVDVEAACAFVTCSFDAGWFVKAQQHSGMDSARFWLNEGILRLPEGMAGRYQEMAKRGQYFAHLAERHNLTPTELDRFLVDRAISNTEHLTMLNLAPVDLFSQAA
ncbi:phosphoadenosine phosphosulfate reductase family protein (plasmid) [Burkholderia pseudomallei]|uniref:phosphoadenosine phosphosulfate reductase domain-containing protein n=1 Tax=Burkholderia pseudomallei TaxID=28450 RepID=UPI00050F6A27|nr:phosphoadenosine phosphosulfate reductase family protein [Burkholderia pseudomallei]AIV73808.1 phosphoadenosine phosphosulfate reductase family protein [Burkholderia pseudomallei]KGD55170.1 phosphoadenosine phosphosulfate reductase family protein [Burkholderia pseudomallei]